MPDVMLKDRHGVQIHEYDGFKMECDVVPLPDGRVQWGLHQGVFYAAEFRLAIAAAMGDIPATDSRLASGEEVRLLEREARVRDHSNDDWLPHDDNWDVFSSYSVRPGKPRRRGHLPWRKKEATIEIGTSSITPLDHFWLADVLGALDRIGR